MGRSRRGGLSPLARVLHRRGLRRGENRGSCVRTTKQDKDTKLVAVADRAGLPLAVHAASTSPHEVTLVKDTLAQSRVAAKSPRLTGDRAHDSDQLDSALPRNPDPL